MERLHYSRALLDGLRGFYRMLANRPLQKAASEFGEISPLLILCLMDFVSCLPEWVPPTFFFFMFILQHHHEILIACFWIKLFLQDWDTLRDYSGKVFVRNFSFPAYFEGRAFPALFLCASEENQYSVLKKGGGFIWDNDFTLAVEGNGNAVVKWGKRSPEHWILIGFIFYKFW